MTHTLDTTPRTLPALRADILRRIATDHAHLGCGCAIISAFDTLAMIDEEIRWRATHDRPWRTP